MNYQNRPFPAGLDGQGRYETRQAEDCPIEAAAAATEIGADDYESADMEILEWLFRSALTASALIMLGVFAWQLIDACMAGSL